MSGKGIDPLVGQVTQMGNVPAVQGQGEIGNLVQDLKGLKELADTVDSILSKVVAMRGKSGQKKTETQGFTGHAQQVPPTTMSSGTSEQKVEVREVEKVVYVTKRIEPEKIKAMLEDLLYIQAQEKLPDEIKQRPVSDLIGDKFKNEFKFMFKGIIPVNADQILDTMSKELSKMIGLIQNDKSDKTQEN